MNALSPEDDGISAPALAALVGPLVFGGFLIVLVWTVITAQPRPVAPAVPKAQVEAMISHMAMADLPGGAFLMGQPPPASDMLEGAPQHRVVLKPFRIGRYDVTFDQYDTFARATGRTLPDDEGWGRGARPVINVTWADVHAFIDWLNRESGRSFRLPSEAEWEYADRAGTAGDFWWGTRMDGDHANTDIGGGRDHWAHTSPVGSFPANPWGLYDMQGDVEQRVEDCYRHSYQGAPDDGRASVWSDCDARVVRGGSWFTRDRASRASARGAAAEDFTSTTLGLRLAEDAGSKAVTWKH